MLTLGYAGNTMGFYRYLGLTDVLTNSGYVRKVHCFKAVYLGWATAVQFLSPYYKYIKKIEE